MKSLGHDMPLYILPFHHPNSPYMAGHCVASSRIYRIRGGAHRFLERVGGLGSEEGHAGRGSEQDREPLPRIRPNV